MNNGFSVIPAIDIQDGEVVQLVQGKRGTERRYGDPATAARRWVSDGAKRLHLIDLDGAFAGERKNIDAIEAIVDAVDVPVQLGGGIRSVADASALLDRNIEGVILGTLAIEEPQVVSELVESYPDRVIVSLDAKDDRVVIDGWTTQTDLSPATAAIEYESLGAAAILFTDVDVEGQLGGVRTDRITSVTEAVDIPVIASGGVSSLNDVQAIKEAGAAAVVVGSALYEGRFTLREAIETV